MRSRASRRLQWWKGARALVAALSLLAATLAAGHRYLTCARMTGVLLEPCYQHGAPGSEARIDADACCHASHFASPDQGVVAASRVVIAAPAHTREVVGLRAPVSLI